MARIRHQSSPLHSLRRRATRQRQAQGLHAMPCQTFRAQANPHRIRIMTDIIENITDRAKAAGHEINAILERAGVNESTWWRWQNGKASPTLKTLQKIGRILDEIESGIA
jgi:transcriptional regulator with XRE-family HTH domain